MLTYSIDTAFVQNRAICSTAPRGFHIYGNDTTVVARDNITTAGTFDIDATVNGLITEREALQTRFNCH